MAKATGVLAVLTGVAASALLAATPATADPPAKPKIDQKQSLFMDYLTKNGVPYTSAPKAVELAQETCSTLGSSSPTRVQDAETVIQDSISMRPSQMQLFAGAAISTYCPSVTIS